MNVPTLDGWLDIINSDDNEPSEENVSTLIKETRIYQNGKLIEVIKEYDEDYDEGSLTT